MTGFPGAVTVFLLGAVAFLLGFAIGGVIFYAAGYRRGVEILEERCPRAWRILAERLRNLVGAGKLPVACFSGKTPIRPRGQFRLPEIPPAWTCECGQRLIIADSCNACGRPRQIDRFVKDVQRAGVSPVALLVEAPEPERVDRKVEFDQ